VLVRQVFLLCAVLLAIIAPGALAQSTSDAQVSSFEFRLESLRGRLKAVEAVLQEGGAADAALNDQKNAVESIQLDSLAEASKLRAPTSEVMQQLERLGPPPEAGTAEPSALAAQRRILETRAARLAAAQKQVELLDGEAATALNRIYTIQREQFFGRIFKSDKSVLNPRLWYDTGVGLWSFAAATIRIFEEAFQNARNNSNPLGLLLLPACAAILFMVWKAAQRALGFSPVGKVENETHQLAPVQRLWRALVGLLGLTVIVFAGMILIDATVELANITTPRAKAYLDAFLKVLSNGILYAAVTYFLCAPRAPEARLIAVDDKSARLLPLLVGGAAALSSLGSQLPALFDALRLPLTGMAGQTAVISVAMVGIIGLITAVIQNQAQLGQAEGTSYYLAWFVRFLPIVWALLGSAGFALVLGYIALAYFITGSILDTALFVIILALIHSLADAFSDTLQNPLSRVGQLLRHYTGLTEVGLARIALAFRTSVDSVLVFLSIPVLFLIWTVTWIDMRSIFGWIFNGITIGNITLSPWGILVAILVLGAGIAITRVVTRWLQRRVLSETSLDKGVQDSVRTSASYLGYIIAASFALSAAGLNFSNIAIIAGALGVGIGFGLQSIVNNFVSGLILLAERPVRVGDWVITNAGEGIVKKINVRSTEIETFDSLTVIVPNSNLITESVRNWTHRDTIGRFNVVVTVEEKAKPETVVEIMKSAATQHPKVLRYPEPQVHLSKFINGGMEYSMKCSVADVFESARISSDVRFVIANNLARAKISTKVA
jgi:potassium efflux system protein